MPQRKTAKTEDEQLEEVWQRCVVHFGEDVIRRHDRAYDADRIRRRLAAQQRRIAL